MRKLMEAVEMAQTANPVDTVTLDIPLLIRIFEFAREDAKTDMDLHNLADNMINLSPDGATLTMADYEELVTGLAGDENAEGPSEEEDEYEGDGLVGDKYDTDPEYADMSDNMKQLSRQGR